MKLSKQERENNRASFRAMSLGQKAEYIFAYYKLPLVIALVALVALGSFAARALTHKEARLYVAFANVVPPPEVEASLTSGYLASVNADTQRTEVLCYHELYLSREANTPDHQYAYASRLKVMAAAEGQQLDAALMNQEAYDILSAEGYLLDLSQMFAGAEALRSNRVVLASNQVEVDLSEANTLEEQAVEQANALEVTKSPLLQGFSGDERIYLGVIANSPRKDEAIAYLAYVCP